MFQLFHEILYRPLFNALVFLYEYVTFEDLGVAIIVLTIAIRFLLYPLFYKSFKHQAVLQKIQPEMKKIQERHRNDKGKQGEAMLALYREHKVNPFSGFFLILIQLPILLALYRVFLNGFSPEAFIDLYPALNAPEHLENSLFGLIDLSKRSIVIVALAAGAQYIQARFSIAKRSGEKTEESMQERIGRQMVFLMPILTVVFLVSLPSAIGLYWFTTSAFSALQQWIIKRQTAESDTPHGTISKQSAGTH